MGYGLPDPRIKVNTSLLTLSSLYSHHPKKIVIRRRTLRALFSPSSLQLRGPFSSAKRAQLYPLQAPRYSYRFSRRMHKPKPRKTRPQFHGCQLQTTTPVPPSPNMRFVATSDAVVRVGHEQKKASQVAEMNHLDLEKRRTAGESLDQVTLRGLRVESRTAPCANLHPLSFSAGQGWVASKQDGADRRGRAVAPEGG